MSTVMRNQRILGVTVDNFSRISGMTETQAKIKKDTLASGFIYDINNIGVIYQSNLDATGRDIKAKKCLAVDNVNNKIALTGDPEKLYVDGFRIVMESNPNLYNHHIITLRANPSNGTQVDFGFLEVWKETVDLDNENAVLFPYGNTQYTASGTFNTCTLNNTDIDAQGAPLYLATSGAHGYYVSVKDENISKFLANPDNNVTVDDNGVLYQLRYRVRVSTVNNMDIRFPYDDTTNIKAQGMAASSSNVSFAKVNTDNGLSIASSNELSLDGKVRAIPLFAVNKRNTGNWSVTNMNGGVNRIDGKTVGVTVDDVIDLRNHVIDNNSFDYRRMVNHALDSILRNELRTVAEPWMKRSSGTGSFTNTGIYGNKLLRAECLVGADVELSDIASWEVQTIIKSKNGIDCKFDGVRSYFSNIPSSQEIMGYIPALNANTANPDPIITYSSGPHIISVDARNMRSGNYFNTDNANRTLVSSKVPKVKFGNAMSTLGINNMECNGEWSGLGTDNASFTMLDESYFVVTCLNADELTLAIDDVYTSSNGVSCTVVGYNAAALTTSAGLIAFKFSGSTLPVWGTLTGADDNTGTYDSITPLSSSSYNLVVVKASTITGIKVGDTFTSSSNTYTVKEIFPATSCLALAADSKTVAAGTFTKATSESGPASFTVSANQLWFKPSYIINGENDSIQSVSYCSYALMPAACPVFVTPSVTFTEGSSVLTRVPYKNNLSFIGCHYYVGNTQILPNNGKGFIPVGYGDSSHCDSHSKTTSLQGFLYKEPVIKKVETSTREKHDHMWVIKDGNTYKMWNRDTINDNDGIFYHTSSDGITWTEGVFCEGLTHASAADDRGNPVVLKDGSVFKMWFMGWTTDSSNEKIFFSTSNDGVDWTTPIVAIDTDSFYTDASLGEIMMTVIKDDSKFKMWVGNTAKVFYCESTDGEHWSSFVLTNKNNNEESEGRIFCIIKEGSVFRCFGNNYMEISADGINWSDRIKLPRTVNDVIIDNSNVYGMTVIKDGPAYKMWYSGNSPDGETRDVFHMVLSCVDKSNTGTSTVGSYATMGNLNMAPDSDSKVVIFYEASAEQSDRRLNNNTQKVAENICKSGWSILSTLDAYTVSSPDALYRDAINVAYPWTDVNGKGASVDSNNTLEIYGVFNLDSMITHLLRDVECTTGINKDKFIVNTTSYVNPSSSPANDVDANISSSANFDIVNTAALAETGCEISSEIVSIDGNLYNAVVASTTQYGFNESIKITRIPGNPILK